MKAKTIFGMVSVLLLTALIMAGCGGSSSSGGNGILKLSMTDAPAEGNITSLMITISKVTISQSSAENTESWITLTETPQTFDVLTLNNAALQELGVKSLPAGVYNQIRFYVTSAQVVIDDVPYDITVPSGKFRTVGSFTLQDGITTELVVDFNVAKSVVYNEVGSGGGYQLKPTTRLTSIATTGAISGQVALNPVSPDTTITVSTTDGNGNEIATVCDSNGSFILGYLPAGAYSLTISADGYDSDISQTGIAVTAGQTTTLTSAVTLNQTETTEETTTP